MGSEGTQIERLSCIAAATIARQKEGSPVHEWALARMDEHSRRRKLHSRVRNLMTTDLFTVNENDVIDLAVALMDWQHIRHVPVEDNDHRLVGLVTHRILLRILLHHGGNDRPTPVREVMERSLITVEPHTPTLEAVRLMKEHKISSLPVVENGRLVGIITERDLVRISQKLLEDFLSEDETG
jgi:CBS domain-containing protein